MITVRQLRYFVSLSRHLKFGRAARDCAISQPALSLQIQELEANLGLELVERGKSSIALTGAGKDIAKRSEAILTALDDLVDFAKHRGGILNGPLRLGVIPSIGPYLLPCILPELKRQFPGLELHLRESQTENLLDAVTERRIDLALLALPVSRPGIRQVDLFEDPFHLLMPRAHPLSGAKAVAMDALQNEKVLLLEEGHCLRDQALKLCGGAGAGNVGEFGATSLATIVQLVGNGYGVTILPEMALGVEARNIDSIAVARFASPPPSRTVGLAWRESSPRWEDFLAFGRVVSATRKAA